LSVGPCADQQLPFHADLDAGQDIGVERLDRVGKLAYLVRFLCFVTHFQKLSGLRRIIDEVTAYCELCYREIRETLHFLKAKSPFISIHIWLHWQILVDLVREFGFR
jgi:hypothetical protein